MLTATQRGEDVLTALAQEIRNERRHLGEVADADAAAGEPEGGACLACRGEGALDGERPHLQQLLVAESAPGRGHTLSMRPCTTRPTRPIRPQL